MSTSWVAVTLLILGVSAFLVLPLLGSRYGRFAEVGLMLQAIGGYFLFTENRVSPVLIGVTILLGVAYNRLVLIPTMRNQRRHTEFDEANAVLGVRGRVVKDLNPVGTVYVNKELWSARSDQYLAKDTSIMVVAQEGLELIVEKAKNEDAPDYTHKSNGVSVR
jgi:membrane-bound ClpP family serine protease